VQREDNHLLAELPHADRERLRAHLKLVYFARGSVLHQAGGKLSHIFFPTDCVVSLMHVLKNGSSVGVAAVNSHGVVGVALFLGADISSERAVVQHAGYAYRLSSTQGKLEFARHGAFFHLLLRYTRDLLTQMSQTATCYRSHSIDQQLCLWLLTALHRQSSNVLAVTQDTIAEFLGVRRESVTAAAGRLQNEGAVLCRRGRVTVLDPNRLAQLCCECYGGGETKTKRFPGDSVRPAPRNGRRQSPARPQTGVIMTTDVKAKMALPKSDVPRHANSVP
jgi:CRP-like cAMP-binding protein